MPTEQIKECRNCKLGEIIGGRSFKLPLSSLNSTILMSRRINRRCLNVGEVVLDEVAGFIEDKVGYQVMPTRVEREVPFAANCDKPEKYSPREGGQAQAR